MFSFNNGETIEQYPQSRCLRVGIVAPNGSHTLDISGAVDTFNETNKNLQGRKCYEVDLIGVSAGPILTSCGIQMLPGVVISEYMGSYDTILVVGCGEPARAANERILLDWLVKRSKTTRRIGSISDGAFVLAAAGLLDDRRVAIHWQAAQQFSSMFPAVRLERDNIFVRDGRIHTAAGSSAGIDLCLQMIESDFGRKISFDIARRQLSFLRRHGGQLQKSQFLNAQATENTQLSDVMSWALENLQMDLSIEQLAKCASMSPRNFRRAFLNEFNTTPSRYIELLRVESARLLLETSSLSIQQIAFLVGFITPGNMRRAFIRVINTLPAAYRQKAMSGIDSSKVRIDA